MYDIKDIFDDHIYPKLDRRLLLAALQPDDLGHAFRCACPSCGERTALISKEGRYIRCREAGGCGFVEGVWAYVQRSRGLSHTETFLHFADMADYVVTHPGPYSFTTLFSSQRKSMLLEEFLTWAEKQLEEASEALAYLTDKRGFSREAIREVKLGYYTSQEAALAHLTARGFSQEAVEDAGVLTKGFGETHHLVVGYRDRVGRLTGIACRFVGTPPDGTPKYVYSYGIDKTSPYNLHKARDFMEVVIVEGIFDVLSLRVHGIDTVIGVEDARLTREQVIQLAACGVRKVILGFDRDDAGIQASEDALEILLGRTGIRSYVLEIPDDYVHPDEFIEDEGVEAYWECIKSAELGAAWKVKHLLGRHDLSTDIGRDGAFREGTAFEETIRDPADGQVFREALAKALDVPLEQLLVTLRTERDVQRRRHLEAGYGDLLKEAGRLLESGRLTRLREHLQEGLYALRSREMVRRIRYFDQNDFLARAKEVPLEQVDLGMGALDKIANVRRGELVVVGARGRHGKSTFAYNLFLNQIERYPEAPSLFFAYEIPDHIAMARIATIWAHKHRGARFAYRNDVISGYPDGKFPKEVFEAFNGLGQYGRERRFSFVYRPGSTVDQIVSYAQKTADERGRVGAIFVDYLELVRTATLRDETFRVAEVLSKLRQLAQELGTTVFVFTLLGQVTEPFEADAGVDEAAIGRELGRRRPELAHFIHPRRLQMESATMLALYNTEREKDVFLHRVSGIGEMSPLEVLVVANREGSAGAHTLTFDMKSGRISEG
jgi:DNA primase